MIEDVIFSRLLTDDKYFTHVIPFIKSDYFSAPAQQQLARVIAAFANKYRKQPTWSAIGVVVEQLADAGKIQDGVYSDIVDYIEEVKQTDSAGDHDFMVEQTEMFCQKRALFNALAEAVEIKDDSDRGVVRKDNRDVGSIPEILNDALAVSFNQQIGHDFWLDYEERWAMYHDKAEKIPFETELLDLITNGGTEKGTLNLIQAQVNIGKSLILCWLAGEYARRGYNVVHFSMEMSEDAVAKRVDSNLMDIHMDQIGEIGKHTFNTGIRRLLKGEPGKLIIKRYPTGGANINHFNSFLQELQLKKGIKPDIIIVDYLSICSSSRIRGNVDNSYGLVKSIAEELRGFAVEHNVTLWSAAQTNRAQWGTADMGMENIAESAGLAATADFILGAISTPELAQQNKILFKQIKSRYGEKTKYPKFTMGVDYGHQRLFGDGELLDNDGNSMTMKKPAQPGVKKREAPPATESAVNINWD